MQAIIDWGIGGFGLYRELKRVRPDYPLLYFSDAGYPPYGTVATAALVDRLGKVISFLEGEGATSIVLACNAASTVAARLRSRVSLPVTDIIESGVDAVLRSGVLSVGIVGGKRTISSGIYQRRFGAEGIDSVGRIAQPLSRMIERGEMDSPLFDRTLRHIIEPLRGAEGLLLACTHYAAAMSRFQDSFPATRIIDPVPTLAERVIIGMGSKKDIRGGSGERIYTSGNGRNLKMGASSAFGMEIGSVERVAL